MAAKVDIAIACGYVQHSAWWTEVFSNIIWEVQRGDISIGAVISSESALPDVAKNRTAGAWIYEDKRNKLTDANRNILAGIDLQGNKLPQGFMQSDADYVMWIDDDTVPPKGAIRKLMDLGREIVAGVYFLGGEPHNPLIYVRQADGFYRAIVNYARGTLIEVDSTGMGCTLIHKSVYQKIMDGHELFQRPNASIMPVHKSLIFDDEVGDGGESHISGGYLHMPLTRPKTDDNRTWPFYALEYGRTEDHHFCELAKNVGIKIYADTTITCKHYKTKTITEQTYLEHLHANYKT